MKSGTVGPRKFLDAQIRRQVPFDQVKDRVKLGMRLDVLKYDLIQVGHGSRDPIQNSGLSLQQFVESWFVLWMPPWSPIIGVKLTDRPWPSALPIEKRINSRQPFTTHLEEKDFTGSAVPAFQRRVSWKPERNSRLQVQNLTTEDHLSMAGNCKVDVMEIISFLLPATAPFGSDLGVEDAYEADPQSFQQVQLDVSRLLENTLPNCAGRGAG